MKQSKLESLIEQVVNILSGLLIAAFIIQPLVFPLYDITTNYFENVTIAIIFTIVSIIRGYLWRRYFNTKHDFQTKLQSFYEQLLNIGSGMLLSALIVQPLVFPLYNISTTILDNLGISLLFTLASLIRSYIWRRLFNRGIHNIIHNIVNHIKRKERIQ
ncbi:MAG: hypothetical protein WC136_00275 [Sphaerochaeta sp.]|jgi:uncharacterized membrane protein YeiB